MDVAKSAAVKAAMTAAEIASVVVLWRRIHASPRRQRLYWRPRSPSWRFLLSPEGASGSPPGLACCSSPSFMRPWVCSHSLTRCFLRVELRLDLVLMAMVAAFGMTCRQDASLFFFRRFLGFFFAAGAFSSAR